jgi:hypothetical protein
MVHSLQARQYSHTGNPWQVHDHRWTQKQQLQEMAENDHEQWIELHQHNQQHPQMELTEIQQQIQQPNLQMQLMEQIFEWVLLLEPQVQKEKTQQEQLQ